MGTIAAACPYCSVQNVSFNSVYDFSTFAGELRTAMKCGNCGEVVIRGYENLRGKGPPKDIQGNLEAAGFLFNSQWPVPDSGAAPDHVPNNIGNFFQQGTNSLLSGNFDAAAVMFRKTLEASTKERAPGEAKLPLIKRIEHLVQDGHLTREIGAWAHEIRVGGNEAAHEEEVFSKEDADALRAFTEAYLRYVYTLPVMVRNRASAAEN